MSSIVEFRSGSWTAVDLVARFGAIPLQRVRTDPAPGLASEEDVIRIHDRESRLFELVAGTLVEKAMGTYESYLAAQLLRFVGNFAAEQDLGIVLGADGILQLSPGLVRIPDVSFIAWRHLPGRRIPDQAIAALTPDLAVEVISAGNTREEMEGKLAEYREAGVGLVWYIYPQLRQVYVYRRLGTAAIVDESQSLNGGDVLPGFELPLSRLF